MHYFIKDTEFEKILKFLSQEKWIHTKNTISLRTFIEAVFYMSKAGCAWRFLPIYYGNWRTVHKRFKQWSERNIWARLFQSLQIDPDMEYVSIDATIVRSHACAAGYGKQSEQALGRSKGGFTTKVHALVDALGNPLKFLLTPGQQNDITQAKLLSESIQESHVIADKAYDCDDFIDYLSNKRCVPVIPPRRNRKIIRKYDKEIYKERHVIECFFSKVKHFRRIFSRYDKTAQSYLSFLHFVGALIWIR